MNVKVIAAIFAATSFLSLLADAWVDANGVTWTYVLREGKVSLGSGSNYGSTGRAVDGQVVGDLTIPDAINGNVVTSIGDYAFRDCTFLTSISVSSNVTSVGHYAFENCTGLKSVEFHNPAVDIEYNAFMGCESMADSDGFLIVENILFGYYGAEKHVAIPGGVEVIGYCAFMNNDAVRSISVPASVTFIEKGGLDGKNVIAVYVEDLSAWCNAEFNCRPLDGRDFYLNGTLVDCLDIPPDVLELPTCSFSSCPCIKSVRIPGGAVKIKGSAFSDCENLGRVEVHGSVEEIGWNAFYNCSSLTSIVFACNAPIVGSRAFYGVANDCTAFVSRDSSGWNVVIPGAWNGIGIEYAESFSEEIVIPAEHLVCGIVDMDEVFQNLYEAQTSGLTELTDAERARLAANCMSNVLHAIWLISDKIEHGELVNSEGVDDLYSCTADMLCALGISLTDNMKSLFSEQIVSATCGLMVSSAKGRCAGGFLNDALVGLSGVLCTLGTSISGRMRCSFSTNILSCSARTIRSCSESGTNVVWVAGIEDGVVDVLMTLGVGLFPSDAAVLQTFNDETTYAMKSTQEGDGLQQAYSNMLLSVDKLTDLFHPVRQYKVEFQSETWVNPVIKYIVDGQPLGSYPVPSSGPVAFLGWYTARDGGESVDSSSEVSSDAVYHARFDSVSQLQALSEVFGANSAVVLNVTNVVEQIKFNDFITFCTSDVSSLTDAQKGNAYDAYKLSEITVVPALYENRPELVISDLEPVGDRLSLSVSLSEGSTPIEMVASRLAESIRVGTSIDSIDSIPEIVERPDANGSHLSFTLSPPQGKQCFIRIVVK